MDERFELLKKYNLWGDSQVDFGYERVEYTGKISDYIGNRLVKVLVGQRRTGKSYLMRQIARKLIAGGVRPENTLFINRELSAFDFLKNSTDLDALISLYVKEIKPVGKVYLFIDEIQLIEGWERTVNSYSQDYTADYEIFISGSNSKMLSGELATMLSGRYVEFVVYPLGYAEFLSVCGRPVGRDSYIEYMDTGGLPELFSLPDKQEVRYNYLESVKDSVLLKDIIQRYSVRDSRLLEDIFSFLVNNASNLVSISGIINYFKARNRKVGYEIVSAYIGYIEDAFLIHKCDRFGIGGKEVLSGAAKYYINDLSYKNFLYPGFSYGVGYKLENLVYLQLKRSGYTVYTGVTKGKEVDFIAQRRDRVIYVQVAYSLHDGQTAEREYASLESIRDNYEKVVVSLDDMTYPSNNGIRHIRAWDFHTLL